MRKKNLGGGVCKVTEGFFLVEVCIYIAMSSAVSSAPISFIGSGWNLNNPTSHYFM